MGRTGQSGGIFPDRAPSLRQVPRHSGRKQRRSTIHWPASRRSRGEPIAGTHSVPFVTALASEKRNVYLQVIPATHVRLKEKCFKVELAGEEKIGDKPAVAIKVTGPDGKEFKLSFDKESGLPVRFSARVMGFRGEEYHQETSFSNYQVMNGIRKATKIESKRDGEPFMVQEVTEFKVLDSSVPPDTFAEPK